MKEKIFKEEMKGFNISIDDIEPSDDMFGAIQQAITKMNIEYLIDRYEVVLNDNLIDFKDKITNFRTILGCRISYDNLSKDISFIVRKDTKPTYEQLQQELERYKNIIDGMEKFFQYAYDNEVRPLNDRKVSVWTICLDKLKELKGSDN